MAFLTVTVHGGHRVIFFGSELEVWLLNTQLTHVDRGIRAQIPDKTKMRLHISQSHRHRLEISQGLGHLELGIQPDQLETKGPSCKVQPWGQAPLKC